MYSNARLSRASSMTSTTSRQAPRSTLDMFEVGTTRPPCSTFSHTTAIPHHKQRAKQLLESSMKTTTVYLTPELYQLNPAVVPFSSFHQSAAHASPCSNAVPFTPKAHSPPKPPKQAGTVVELPKHRPIAEHVGATHHKYPQTAIGDTLLKQQAILTINGLPSLIAQLKDDLADITMARSGTAKKKESPKKREKKQSEPPPLHPPLDYDVLEQMNEYQRVLREYQRVLLRINPNSADPLKDKDLIALKNLNAIDKATASMSQQQAHRLATEAMEDIEAQLAVLKGE